MFDTQDRSECEGCYEVYYIKEEALKLLLAGLGQKRWYGIFSEEPVDTSIGKVHRISEKSEANIRSIRKKESSVNSLLAELYQNGVIDWKEKGVVVRNPYADLLSAMLEKKICITMQISGTSSLLRCCYLSSTAVVMTQKSQREPNTLGMSQIPIRSWLNLLEEECIRLEEECIILSCRSSTHGQIYKNIKIQKNGLRTFSIKQDDGSSIHCMREELGIRMMELLLSDCVPQQ